MRDKNTVATIHSEALPGFAKARSCQLLVVDGPDAGRAVSLDKAASNDLSEGRELRVGSGEDCDLVLTDERVSRHHLGVTESAGRFLVRDLGSKGNASHGGSCRGDQSAVMRTVRFTWAYVSISPAMKAARARGNRAAASHTGRRCMLRRPSAGCGGCPARRRRSSAPGTPRSSRCRLRARCRWPWCRRRAGAGRARSGC